MGELLGALNALDECEAARSEPIESFVDAAAQAFWSASQRVNDTIEAIQEPGMPLGILSRWTQRVPLQALAVAFLVGVLATHRRLPRMASTDD
jgi:hypothetical protein